jgi:hypothetical protein
MVRPLFNILLQQNLVYPDNYPSIHMQYAMYFCFLVNFFGLYNSNVSASGWFTANSCVSGHGTIIQLQFLGEFLFGRTQNPYTYTQNKLRMFQPLGDQCDRGLSDRLDTKYCGIIFIPWGQCSRVARHLLLMWGFNIMGSYELYNWLNINDYK